MDYTFTRTGGEIQLTDYEFTHVRFLFADFPYGLVATTMPQAQTDMQILAQDMQDMSGLAVGSMEFSIEFEVSGDSTKPLAASHVEWMGLIACEANTPLGLRNRVLQVPIPHPAIMQSVNELNLSNPNLLAYARLYTELSDSLGGSCATLRGGATIEHNAFENPILDATLKIHHPKLI
jgi:hypothetical protein